MSRPRRRTRESLRGWWRAVPFVLLVGGVLLTFTWLHTQRLKNEYRANRLAREIRQVNDRIGDLRGERYDLGRLERMDAKAPNLELQEPRPGQVRILNLSAEKIAALREGKIEPPKRSRVTRSVVLRVDGLAPSAPPVMDDTAVAQRDGSNVESLENHL